MKNNEKHKQYISRLGVEYTLQSLIEIIDDSIIEENSEPVPSWKIRLLEYLEQAYDTYMNKNDQPVKV